MLICPGGGGQGRLWKCCSSLTSLHRALLCGDKDKCKGVCGLGKVGPKVSLGLGVSAHPLGQCIHCR